MSNIVNKMFSLVLSIQTFLLFVFLMQNINDLDAVEYTFSIAGTDFDLTLNIYVLLALIAVVFVLLMLVSVNIFSTGFNDEGTKNVGRYIGFMILFLVMNVGSLYYLAFYQEIGAIVLLFFAIAYVLKLSETLME